MDGRDDNTVVLEPLMVRDIENLVLTKQLADAEVRLAKIALVEAQRRSQQALATEASIVAKLEEKTGRKLTGRIELLDRDKGLCRLT